MVFTEKDVTAFAEDPARVIQLRRAIDNALNVRHRNNENLRKLWLMRSFTV